MRQLTGLDAQFLALESPRQAGHVGALAVLDPSTRPNGRAPRYLERVVRALPSTLPNLEDAPILNDLPGARTVGRATNRAVQTLKGRPSRVLERTNLTRPRTSFNGRVSPHRRFAFGQLPLEEVKSVKNVYGVTVNDVVVAICAAAVRRWLIEHQELPADPLVAQVPVSVRTEEQQGTYGNRIRHEGASE